MKQLGIVGQSVKRRDGLGHVTGQTQYVDDVFYPNMLWIKMVRSPVSRGKIHKIDTSKAEAFPGVAAVVTAKDVPNNWYTILCLIGVEPNDEPVLAHEEVMYEGEPICAVVAETEEIAREAAALVELEIEEQTPVLDLEFALSPDCAGDQKMGQQHLHLRWHGSPPAALRRCRGRLCAGRLDRRGHLPALADRARADRDALSAWSGPSRMAG